MRFPFLSPAMPQIAERGYVHSFTFSSIGDPFDSNAIWARPRSMRRDQERLKGLLDDHAYRVGGKRHVLSHVEVELPLADVEDDHRISGGESARNLERELAELHTRDLGDKSAAPRYRVRGALDLADDEVRVRFGHGIYLPDRDDRVAWKIEASTDGAIWAPLADLPENQRVAIIGAERGRVSFARCDWPFADVQLIIDNLPSEPRLAVAAKPREALRVTENADLGCMVIEPTGGGVPKLYMRVTRLLPPAEVSAPRHAPTVKAASRPFSISGTEARREPSLVETVAPSVPVAEGTLVPGVPPSHPTDETWVVGTLPSRRPALHLAGLAIPRLSRFSGYGIRALRFGLGAEGEVLPPSSSACALRFEVRADDGIWVATRGGERKLSINEKLPLPAGGVTELLPMPPELAERYGGWMPLPAGPAVPIELGAAFEAGRGRELTTLHRIQVLAATGFLDADHDPGADCLGISSRHARFEQGEDGLRVSALGRMPLAILTADHALVHVLQCGEEWVLQKGQSLVFGHYVWTWEPEAVLTGTGA